MYGRHRQPTAVLAPVTRAGARKPKPQDTYLQAARLLREHPAAEGLRTDVGALRKEDVEDYIGHLLDRYARPRPQSATGRSSSSSRVRARGRGEGLTDGRMRPPLVPEEPVPVLTDAELRRPNVSTAWGLFGIETTESRLGPGSRKLR